MNGKHINDQIWGLREGSDKNKQIHPLLIVLSKQRKEFCHTFQKKKKSQHKISYDSDTCDKKFRERCKS